MRVLSVVGNRPQFIKSAPLFAALRDAGVEDIALHTGQHYDPELSQVFYDELGLEEPRYRLDVREADPHRMVPGIREAVEREQPDWVLVYGDTNSTLAGAQAAGATAVAHVEAGLRSFDLEMPEERNRIAIDRISALLLCPDERSAAQLESEGVSGRREVVGDVMADATRVFAPIARKRVRAEWPEPYAALTIHREANTEPDRLRALIDELNATGWTFVFPVHPRTRKVMDEHGIEPAPQLHAIEPVGYLEMLALVAGATRVVTDSGGLQKEAYWLRVPCVTLRASTEWVDTVAVGANRLARPGEVAAVLEEASFPEDAPELYGDGHAAARIADSLVRLPAS